MTEYQKVIKNKDFLYVWISQILSQVTINIMNFVVLVKLFAETGSAIATSFLWIAYALPALIFGPIASASVDFLDKKKVLMITNLCQSLVIFLYSLLAHKALLSLYGLAMTYSFFNQFYVPAEQASLATLVKKENLPYANSLFFITQQLSLIVGFSIAGLLNHFLGFENSLFLGAIFLFMAFVSVSFLPSMKSSEVEKGSLDKAILSFLSGILEGYRYIRANRRILAALLLMLGLSMTLAIVTINVPIFALEILKVNTNLAGVLVVVPAGIGAAISALVVPKLLKKSFGKRALIENSLALMFWSLMFIVFIVPILRSTTRVVVSFISTVFLGVSYLGAFLPSQTFLQEETPEDFRGRVFGNYWFLTTIITVIPIIFAGTIAQYLGLRGLLVILAAFPLYAFVYSKAKGSEVFNKNDK